MNDRYLLTPYFLDDEVPQLRTLAQDDWVVTAAELPEAETPANVRPAKERMARMTALYQPLRDSVSKVVAAGDRPVSVAGDCCATLAVFSGLQSAGVKPTLLWFDAHGDFNTWQTTPSGFLGGMPLAMMVGRGDQTLVDGVGLQLAPEKDVWLSDGRDLDQGERLALDDSKVHLVQNVEDLHGGPLPAGPYYVHFDCDILDPAEAPAVSYPAPGGPHSDLVRQVFRRLASTGNVRAVSLSAWNPAMDGAKGTGELVMSVFEELLA